MVWCTCRSVDRMEEGMKHLFLLYDTCCMYEIMILNYFLRYTGQEVVFCSLNGEAVLSMEGYSVNVEGALADVDVSNLKGMIVPGGDKTYINKPEVHQVLREMAEAGHLVAGICGGVDVLEASGILKGKKSTHTEDVEIIRDDNIVTARDNAYVDFAVEITDYLDLFEDERDRLETIDFWKYHKRALDE